MPIPDGDWYDFRYWISHVDTLLTLLCEEIMHEEMIRSQGKSKNDDYVILRTCSCSVTQLCLTLCNCKNCSILGVPVLHYLPEFAQTHVHWVNAVIQPPHPLLPPSPPALSLFQYQSFFLSWLFTSVTESIGASASVLPVNIQGGFPLGWTGLISLQPKRDSQESSPAP